MTVKDAADALLLEPLALPESGRVIKRGYTGDLLSWVMGNAPGECAWVTIMSNPNVIAVATLLDVACVIIAEGAEVEPEIIKLAGQKGINLLRSKEKAFELCARLYGMLAQ